MDYGQLISDGLRKRTEDTAQSSEQLKSVAEAMAQGTAMLQLMSRYHPEVTVTNFPKTPEFPKLPEFDPTPIVEAINNRPLPETPDNSELASLIQQLITYSKASHEVLNALKLDPQVTVEAPQVNVDAPDLKPVVKAIKEAKPAPLDLSSIQKGLEDNQKTLSQLVDLISALPEKMPKTHVDVDPLVTFQAIDIDDAGVVQYFGFQRSGDLGWYIKKMDTGATPKTIRWVTGQGDYATQWPNRASLSYTRWGE
jgi:hypothetical protein